MKKAKFARDFGLKGQIQDAAGSSKGFGGSGFIGQPRTKNPQRGTPIRTCMIMPGAPLPCLGTLIGRAAIRGFIKYLMAYERGQRKKGNPIRLSSSQAER